MLLKRVRLLLFLIIGLILILPFCIQANKKSELPSSAPVMWREPDDIASRDLFYGQGGKEDMPEGEFKFIKSTPGGSQPKFIAEDSRGVRWKVKLGVEARPETAAERLLWAVGYFTDETYYLPEMRIENAKKMQREFKFSDSFSKSFSNGLVKGARLERQQPGKRLADWSWFDNPFTGKSELNQLKVMMALINNWDLKEINNSVFYDETTHQIRYYISDLGAAFGKSGGNSTRSKGIPADYANSKFIKSIGSQKVDFALNPRASWYTIFYLPYYLERARMAKIVKDIPRSDAKHMGEWLERLSDEQIRDAFRAAGYKPDEVEKYSSTLRARIDELNRL